MPQIDDRSNNKRKKALGVALYSLLLLSFAFFSYQLWVYYERYTRIRSSVVEVKTNKKQLVDVEDDLRGGKAGGMQDISAVFPLSPFQGLKLKFSSGRKFTRNGCVELQWVYECNIPFADLRSYYISGLKEIGYEYIDTGARQRGRETMVFRMGTRNIRIILKSLVEDMEYVAEVVVIEYRPEQPGDFQ